MATTPKSAARGEIGKLTLEINADALKRIASEGRLLELAATMGAEAGAQISAQIVDRIGEIAAGGGGGGVGATFVLEGGDFGTIPPRPKFGVGRLRESLLQRAVMPGADVVLNG